MIRDDKTRDHRITYEYALHLIPDGDWKCRDEFQGIMQQYIHAKVEWSLHNTDETMINLIGTWARFTRIMHTVDNKYGRRE